MVFLQTTEDFKGITGMTIDQASLYERALYERCLETGRIKSSSGVLGVNLCSLG